MEKKATAEVTLTWPIPAEGGAEITKLTFRRPKGKAIKKALALLGPDAVNAILDQDAANTTRDKVISQLAGLVTTDKLDGVSDLIGDLCGQPGAVIDEIDPADYPAIFKALGDFFPGITSPGEGSPQT